MAEILGDLHSNTIERYKRELGTVSSDGVSLFPLVSRLASVWLWASRCTPWAGWHKLCHRLQHLQCSRMQRLYHAWVEYRLELFHMGFMGVLVHISVFVAAVLPVKAPFTAHRRNSNPCAAKLPVKKAYVHLRCWMPGSSPGSLSNCPVKESDGDDTDKAAPAQPNQSEASSTPSTNAPRGIRWLDREVRQGNVAEEQLVGADGRPPIKTDMLLRSYSKKPR